MLQASNVHLVLTIFKYKIKSAPLSQDFFTFWDLQQPAISKSLNKPQWARNR